jgi:MerR family transcriptional regulator, thiopeptide resistance regulator
LRAGWVSVSCCSDEKARHAQVGALTLTLRQAVKHAEVAAMEPRRYRVNEVARLSGVSVRTLHHYDQIGLLAPSGRSEAGYRQYSDADLLRLQQILVQRALGLPLEEIRRLLDDPGFDRVAALRRQRRELLVRAEQTSAMIRAIDAALRALEPPEPNPDGESEMSIDMREIFDGFDPAQYEAEAERRWGDSAAYKESQRRVKGYTAEDWRRQQQENALIMQDAAAAMSGGKRPDDPEVREIAERHRLSIDRWFYPCSKVMHGSLADLYEADQRFAANIDEFAPGLTPFLAAAIRANAARS